MGNHIYMHYMCVYIYMYIYMHYMYIYVCVGHGQSAVDNAESRPEFRHVACITLPFYILGPRSCSCRWCGTGTRQGHCQVIIYYTCIHTHIHTYTHTHIHTHTYTHAHIHTYIHTHTYSQRGSVIASAVIMAQDWSTVCQCQ